MAHVSVVLKHDIHLLILLAKLNIRQPTRITFGSLRILLIQVDIVSVEREGGESKQRC